MEKASIMDCFLGNKKRIYKYLGKRKGLYTGHKDINGVSIRNGDIVYSPYYPMVSSVCVTTMNGKTFDIVCSCYAGLFGFTDKCIVIGTKYNHDYLLSCNDFWPGYNITISNLAIISSKSRNEIRNLIKEGKIHSTKTKGGYTKLSKDDIDKAFESGLLISFLYTDYNFSKCVGTFGKFVYERFKPFLENYK